MEKIYDKKKKSKYDDYIEKIDKETRKIWDLY